KIAMVDSPLTALVWVFAISAGLLGTLTIGALALAYRHRLRRRAGVYIQVLAATQSSLISQILTVGDLLKDTALREQISLKLASVAQTQVIQTQVTQTKVAKAQAGQTIPPRRTEH